MENSKMLNVVSYEDNHFIGSYKIDSENILDKLENMFKRKLIIFIDNIEMFANIPDNYIIIKSINELKEPTENSLIIINKLDRIEVLKELKNSQNKSYINIVVTKG